MCVISEVQGESTTFTFFDPVRGRGTEFGRTDVAVPGTWALSPDGKQIAYLPQEEGGEIRFISSDGRNRLPINLGAEKLQAVTWSADQKSLYISGWSNEDWHVQQVSFDGETKTLLRYPTVKWLKLFDISPDGRYMTYVERTYESNP